MKNLARRPAADRRRGGFILILATILLAFLAAMAFAFSQVVRTEALMADHHGMGAQAYWVADSGLRRAFYNLYLRAPGTHTWTETRPYAASTGSSSGGTYSFTVSSAETTTSLSSTFGDLRIQAAATIAGYDATKAAHTLVAVLPNLANDDDANPATPPTAAASSAAGANPARLAGDGSLTTYWTATAAATAASPQWLSIAFAATTTLRKVQVVCPDRRIQTWAVQVDSGGWKAASNAVATAATVAGRYTLTAVFDEVSATAVRIYITASSQAPRISEFKAYPPARSARLSEPGS